MGINKGYLTSNRTKEGDEIYTPFYAVEPIIEFLQKDKVIWCPFDENWSAFVQLLKEKGYKVINSNLKNGQDFFEYEPENYDVIVSNPPFSLKDKIIERLYKLDKPFAMILPIQTLQSKNRYKELSKGCECLVFDERIGFHTKQNYKKVTEGSAFASIYICRNLLPEKLIFRELKKYERELK